MKSLSFIEWQYYDWMKRLKDGCSWCGSGIDPANYWIIPGSCGGYYYCHSCYCQHSGEMINKSVEGNDPNEFYMKNLLDPSGVTLIPVSAVTPEVLKELGYRD